ncbi:no significant blast hit [Histoplasma capsulatum var. duboisii H88]|uniref:No significant blast hit n=1 Tax=Ajellomyces capsulatus (strain H88) TaxID=544711 RepID=A0A8A1LE94_AJEC8|nr:no significant blast hit [Histoplasma capsulatum var. duboisii H88]
MMSSTSENPSPINIKQLMDLLHKEKIVKYHNISESTVKEFLELSDCKNLKLSYNPQTKTVKIVIPTWIHSGCLNWIQDWIAGFRGLEQWNQRTISAAGEGELKVFAGEYANRIVMPDCAIFVSTLEYPTIAMEIAYTETYEDLKKHARLLLEGTAGMISIAILVKIVPLRSDESHIQSAVTGVLPINGLSTILIQFTN